MLNQAKNKFQIILSALLASVLAFQPSAFSMQGFRARFVPVVRQQLAPAIQRFAPGQSQMPQYTIPSGQQFAQDPSSVYQLGAEESQFEVIRPEFGGVPITQLTQPGELRPTMSERDREWREQQDEEWREIQKQIAERQARRAEEAERAQQPTMTEAEAREAEAEGARQLGLTEPALNSAQSIKEWLSETQTLLLRLPTNFTRTAESLVALLGSRTIKLRARKDVSETDDLIKLRFEQLKGLVEAPGLDAGIVGKLQNHFRKFEQLYPELVEELAPEAEPVEPAVEPEGAGAFLREHYVSISRWFGASRVNVTKTKDLLLDRALDYIKRFEDLTPAEKKKLRKTLQKLYKKGWLDDPLLILLLHELLTEAGEAISEELEEDVQRARAAEAEPAEPVEPVEPEVEQELEEAREQLTDALEENDALEETNKRQATELAQLGSEVQPLRHQVFDLTGTVVSLTRELAAAKAAAVVEAAVPALEEVQSTPAGLWDVAGYEAQIRDLQRDIENLKRQLAEAQQNAQTAQGQLAEFQANINVTVTQRVQAEVKLAKQQFETEKASLTRKIDELNRSLSQVQGERDTATQMAQDFQDQMEKANRDMRRTFAAWKLEYEQRRSQRLQQIRQESDSEVERMRAEFRQAKIDLEQAHRERLAQMETEKNEAVEQATREADTRWTEEVARIRAQLAQEQEDAVTAAREALNLEWTERVQEIRAQLEVEKDDAVGRERRAREDAEERADTAEGNLARTQQELEDVQEDVEEKGGLIARLRGGMTSAKAQLADWAQRFQDWLAERKQFQDRNSYLEERVLVLEGTAQDLENTINDQQDTIVDLKKRARRRPRRKATRKPPDEAPAPTEEEEVAPAEEAESPERPEELPEPGPEEEFLEEFERQEPEQSRAAFLPGSSYVDLPGFGGPIEFVEPPSPEGIEPILPGPIIAPQPEDEKEKEETEQPPLPFEGFDRPRLEVKHPSERPPRELAEPGVGPTPSGAVPDLGLEGVPGAEAAVPGARVPAEGVAPAQDPGEIEPFEEEDFDFGPEGELIPKPVVTPTKEEEPGVPESGEPDWISDVEDPIKSVKDPDVPN